MIWSNRFGTLAFLSRANPKHHFYLSVDTVFSEQLYIFCEIFYAVAIIILHVFQVSFNLKKRREERKRKQAHTVFWHSLLSPSSSRGRIIEYSILSLANRLAAHVAIRLYFSCTINSNKAKTQINFGVALQRDPRHPGRRTSKMKRFIFSQHEQVFVINSEKPCFDLFLLKQMQIWWITLGLVVWTVVKTR